ncbi:aspartate/glutamate racemase family protein [Microbacterium sp. 5K110]|jgi:hypothetical protein|uniref:aspartate/glutamate racemase family protein n=1 Tax=unclassified Microbacterium TaxID=2609290 RepID=UPI0010FF0EC5|nr:aspartate/glutamate racemase family protein [Microbacterium sp. 5K110]TLF30901.1 hypothetical protein FE256_09155 [Microbacterium sp. 5K110]
MNTSPGPLIALISAVPAAIPPVDAALAASGGAAQVWNILDDRLLQDAADAGGLNATLEARMERLIEHASLEGADAVLLTCSMYAPVAHRAQGRLSIPVAGPDDALFEAATSGRYRRVLLVSSAGGPLADSMQRLREVAQGVVEVTGVVAEGAVEAARRGRIDELVARIVAAVSAVSVVPDAVLLGQYSLAHATEGVREATGLTVLTGPELAVAALRSRLGEEAS